MKLTADNEAINYLKDYFNKDFIEITVDGEKKIFVSEEKLKEKDIQIEFLKEEKQLQIKDNQELFEKSINEFNRGYKEGILIEQKLWKDKIKNTFLEDYEKKKNMGKPVIAYWTIKKFVEKLLS